MDLECAMTGNPVTLDPKRLVSGPCWDLYLSYRLFESLSLAVAMMFHVNSCGLTVHSDLFEELECFKHALQSMSRQAVCF